MKIADNTVNAVFDYAVKQLVHLYPENEVRSMVKLALNQYFGFDGNYLAINPSQRFTESELLKFVFLVKELKKERPIQYILGQTEFYGLLFKVNDSVLIPRPETEELINWIIEDERKAKSKVNRRILDIGTGSGCIPISLAKNLPDSEVSSCDISKDALSIAEENAISNTASVNFIEDDFLNSTYTGYSDSYDIIVSNPPYVLESEKESLHANVISNEPHVALFVSNENALIFYSAIIQFAKSHLKKGGVVYFEINEQYGDAIQSLFNENGFTNCLIKKDLSGKDRMVKAILA